MPALTPEQVLESGLAATYNTPDIGGDTIENDGKTILHVINADASPTTVTVAAETATTRKPGFGQLTKPNAESIVAAGTDEFIGPFPTIAFGRVAAIAYTNVTAITVAVLRV